MPVDYSKYPDNWKKKIIPFILDRDKHCCGFCGLKNKQLVRSVIIKIVAEDGKIKNKRFWFESDSDLVRVKPLVVGESKVVRVILTVAHLDHDEQNHNVSMDRLKALCQFCHLNYDIKEKKERIKKSL